MNVTHIVDALRRIAQRRPADRHMANAFLRAREEARQMVKDVGSAGVGALSDGYHSYDELYAHRHALFLALMRAEPALSWRSRVHDDGTTREGWWLAGMDLPTGTVTYHLPESLWSTLDAVAGLRTLPQAPGWDGHTSSDVVERLHGWAP